MDHLPLPIDHPPLPIDYPPLPIDHTPLPIDHTPLPTDYPPLPVDPVLLFLSLYLALFLPTARSPPVFYLSASPIDIVTWAWTAHARADYRICHVCALRTAQ